MKLFSLTIFFLASFALSGQTTLAIDVIVVNLIENSIDMSDNLEVSKEITNEEGVNLKRNAKTEISLDLNYLTDELNSNHPIVPETFNDLEYREEISSLQENE